MNFIKLLVFNLFLSWLLLTVNTNPTEYILSCLVADDLDEYNSGLEFAAALINNRTDILPDTTLILDRRLSRYVESFEIATMIEFSDNDKTLVAGNEYSFLSVLTGIVGNVYGIAQISVSATSSVLSDTKTYPYFSRVFSPSGFQVFVMFDTLLHYEKEAGRGWTDIAIISTTDAFGVDGASLIIDNSEEYGFSVLTYQQYLVDAENFDIELNEVKKSGARVIIAFVLEQWELLIVAANEHGLVGDDYVWLAPDTVSGYDIVNEEARELSRGLLGTFQYIPDSGEIYDSLIEQWQALDPTIYPGAGPDTTPGLYTIFGMDTITTAAYAIDIVNSQGELDQQRVPAEVWFDAILQVEFEGFTGHVSFDDIGNRIGQFSLTYFDPDEGWVHAILWTPEEGIEIQNDIVWHSGSTQPPDLDIRKPFSYWSCHDREEGYDSTGKEISLHTPDGSDIDDIDSTYHCDQFIDCKNMSDESVDCPQNYIILFIVFGIITGLLIFITLGLLIFVCIFGIILKYRRLKVASPVFLLILLISVIIAYISIYAWFGKPHPVACAFQPWLLGLPTISMISALCSKVFRIWRIFRNPLIRNKITDLELLVLWIIMMIPALFIITLWTIISTPTASIIERDGEDHYVCNTGGFTGEPGGLVFFLILVVYGALILLFGIFLSIVTRKVPSMFNESKLLAISIYNIGFLSIVVIPIFIILERINPFAAWIIRTLAILYIFTATIILQFISPVCGIIIVDKFRNVKHLNQRTLKTSGSSSLSSNKSIG